MWLTLEILLTSCVVWMHGFYIRDNKMAIARSFVSRSHVRVSSVVVILCHQEGKPGL